MPTRAAIKKFVETAMIYVLALQTGTRDYGSFKTDIFDNVTSLEEYMEIACDYTQRVMKDCKPEDRIDRMYDVIGGIIPVSTNLHGDQFDTLRELFWELAW